MRATIVILFALLLILLAPVALAHDFNVGEWCVNVDPSAFPPLAVYEC